jgi:hypothetical protein
VVEANLIGGFAISTVFFAWVFVVISWWVGGEIVVFRGRVFGA